MKKIARRALCAACAVITAGGAAAYMAGKYKDDAVTTMAGASKETPVIVLDAGHGECF